MKSPTNHSISYKDYAYFVVAILVLLLIRHGAELSTNLFFGTKFDEQIRLGYLLEQFKLVFETGILYPRWLGHLYGGYGYPTFDFYQPGQFFLMLPLTYLVSEPHHAVLIYKILLQCLYYYVIFLIARKYNATPWAIIFFWLIVTPQLQMQSNSYGSPVFLLLSIYSALSAVAGFNNRQHYWHYYFLFILSCSLLISIHPTQGYTSAIVVFALFVGLIWQYGSVDVRKMIIAFFVSAGALSLILTAPYWYTACTMQDKVDFEGTISGYFSAKSAFARIDSPLGYIFNSFGNYKILPFRVFYMSLTVAGLYLLRNQKPFRVLAVVYIFFVYLLSPSSLWLWEHLPGLKYFQYPERISPIKDILECFIITVALSKYSSTLRLNSFIPRFAYISFVMLWLATCFFLYQPFHYLGSNTQKDLKQNIINEVLPISNETRYAFNYSDHKEYLEHNKGFVHFQNPNNNLRPLTAIRGELKDRLKYRLPIAQIIDGKGLEVAFHITKGNYKPWSPIEMSLYVPNSVASVSVIINQFYFPGWEVKVNNEPLVLNDKASQTSRLLLNENGLMHVLIKKSGNYTITAHYDGPPHWQLRNIIMFILSLSVLLVYVYYVKQLMKSSTVSQAS